MSTPEPSGMRQRANLEEHKNPASLSASSDKKVQRNKPDVKPPLSGVSMNKFLTYMVLGLALLAAFYTWRFTVWAAQAGGYWNLLSGRTVPPKSSIADTASMASAAASTASAGYAGKGKSAGSKTGGAGDVQSQILQLANSLGIKPAELNAAIRPLIDPSVPNPAEQAQKELELLKLQQQSGGEHADEPHTGVLGIIGEALLD